MTGTAYKILKGVHVTEKATDLAAKNQYTFKIFSNANKTEVKRIVQEIYGIDVLDVKIITIPGKNKRMGKTLGFRPGCKKAIVRIKEGQKIEVMPK
ncbi:MAG: 50S ribosomal protein L23 [Candidatus Parcubacteria bacterium]|nr:50S ribosomal protein L23 [Candidatus Parcubacteria bacterium]